ncbi:MAG: diaminopimelate decarboxylase [Chloroflexota bacterium]|nr:diaminopimelate decarboxylase [Chloroflexota bacterium]
MLNDHIRYIDNELYCDAIAIDDIIAQTGTPAYIYSLPRALANLRRIQSAFAPLNAHIHYSAKANGNLALLRTLVKAGAGIDCVSGGEVFRALKAGCPPENIVLAGVGKTAEDLRYAVEQRLGWINIENVAECAIIDTYAAAMGAKQRVALRLNPDVAANTIRQIATGHGGTKFGLSADAITALLDQHANYPHLDFAGIHVHIGSQLGDTAATEQAVLAARAIAQRYPSITTLDIGGGLPVAYRPDTKLPDPDAFAQALAPLVSGYEVILEPGRSIIADAGILVAQVLYTKDHGGQHFIILDTGMTELIRPALYDAHHEIVPLVKPSPPAPLPSGEGLADSVRAVEIVGPVCETTDTLAHNRALPPLAPGDHVAILTAGAYGFVMASNYNARPRPPEVVIEPDGNTWRVARRRDTWGDLVASELE